MSAGRFLENLSRRQLDDMLVSIKAEFPELAPFDVSLQDFKAIHQYFKHTENSMLEVRNAVIDKLEQERWCLENSHFLDKKELKKYLNPIVELLVFKKHYQKNQLFNHFYEIQRLDLSIDDKMLHSYLFLKDHPLLLTTMTQQKENKLIPDVEDQQSALRQVTDFLTSNNIEETAGRTYNLIEIGNVVPLQKDEFSRKIQQILTKKVPFVTIIESLTKEMLTHLLGYLSQTFKDQKILPLSFGQLLSAMIQSVVLETKDAPLIQQILEQEITKQIQIFTALVETKAGSDPGYTFEKIMKDLNQGLTLEEAAITERIKQHFSRDFSDKVATYVSFFNYFPDDGRFVSDTVATLMALDDACYRRLAENLSEHPDEIVERFRIARQSAPSPVSIAGRNTPSFFSSKQQRTDSPPPSPTPSSER